MTLFTADQPLSEDLLQLIAHIPTKSLHVLVHDDFFRRFKDEHFMRIAVYLAEKSYQEGGCPIGALVVDNATRRIVGKGHNTLVQENHPYNHGETSAIRDAGRIDFSATTLFTTLSPCDVCATLIYMRQFPRVVVGDITNAHGNEALLERKVYPLISLKTSKVLISMQSIGEGVQTSTWKTGRERQRSTHKFATRTAPLSVPYGEKRCCGLNLEDV